MTSWSRRLPGRGGEHGDCRDSVTRAALYAVLGVTPQRLPPGLR